MPKKSFSKKYIMLFGKLIAATFAASLAALQRSSLYGGQTKRETAFLDVKLHAARFRICVGLLLPYHVLCLWRKSGVNPLSCTLIPSVFKGLWYLSIYTTHTNTTKPLYTSYFRFTIKIKFAVSIYFTT